MESRTFSQLSAVERFGLNADIAGKLTRVDYGTVASGLREQGYFSLNEGDVVNIIAYVVGPRPQVRFPHASPTLGVLPLYGSIQVAPARFTTANEEDIPIRLEPSSDDLRKLRADYNTLRKQLPSPITHPGKNMKEIRRLQQPITLELEGRLGEIHAHRIKLAKDLLGRQEYASVLEEKGIMLDQVGGVTLDVMFPKGTIVNRNDL
jgi:hypothetical protein